jgi:cytochrome d ubiquinol oxidase subunit II
MFDFNSFLDLPLIWGLIIATAVFLYVMLDGFDLGCGILFPFAPSHSCRNKIMNSIAPFWDGNETWLVLGGGGLFAAFPLAYAVLMPAFYMPVILMLLGLIFRGVAFEFRFKTSGKDRKLWDVSFHFGSTLAAFMQGVILGNFVQGVEVTGRAYSGGPFDWVNVFALFCGVALIFGYALLGSTWLIMKTHDDTQVWARKVASYVLGVVLLAMAVVSASMPFMDERIYNLWFVLPNFYVLGLIPLFTGVLFIMLWRDIVAAKREVRPFFLSIGIFLMGFLGLAISIYPWVIPYQYNIWQAAAATTSLSLLLVGTAIFLPVILGYTAYSYYVFRGKSDDKPLY